ncbi:FAD-dependent oxidoreductase [Thorsellia anophelis]|uniref:FAD dependent oxidoreductase n=1 Tax=Thorsellia anophelis DSM 18579 TaxID=1123402 RepID=A0A1I0FF15_9GAMM|nr:FAD-dependent oxidoreductase [Thorsellia anophelis]SET56788.1 FAD dependent oxidoreductase [Thorsellia anophelis DSM 18579]
MTNSVVYDAIIIGGGFYGASIAIYLAQQHKFKKILIIERENSLLQRASYTNQARVHNGYHYPRSFTTAYRSRINLPRFITDWPEAVKIDFDKVYAIARRNSKVTAKQFERFCYQIGAEITPARDSIKKMFNSNLIENVFSVKEYAFDTTELAMWAAQKINKYEIECLYRSTATSVSLRTDKLLEVIYSRQKDLNQNHQVIAKRVFNCTYSGINQIFSYEMGVSAEIKHEITEMALIKMPECLVNLGITVMDGPFFSTMPFPARNLHTLSHVRYTPHLNWIDDKTVNPYHKLAEYHCQTRFDRMIRDVARYVPAISLAQYVDSLFEVKTILMKNEGDDGRPILFETHENLPGMYSVIGGKIDNIYDVLEKLDQIII